jgi:hypothetical protein
LSICLLDTSILCELLEIPDKCGSFAEVTSELERRVQQRESLLLPLPAVLETGNHIGQNGDGRQRRAAAERFIRLVRDAIDGKTPFVPTPFEAEAWRDWLDEFPDWAGRGSGWGDLTILKEFDRQCALNPGRLVYIWSTDRHLSSYRREPL